MARFRYIAVNQSGERISDVLEAVDRAQVLERLQQQGHLAIDVRGTGEGAGSDTAASPLTGRRRGRRISETEITLFTRELSMLLEAGLTLSQSLQMLEAQAASPRLGWLIAELGHALADGQSFEQALAATGMFSPLYVNMIRVAEATGTLRQVLLRLAEDREREAKLRSTAFSAMLYPAFLIITAIAAIVIILLVVVPRFKDIIAGDNAALPASARFVFDASDWLINYGVWLAAGLAAAVVLIWLLCRLSAMRARFETLALRLPVAGGLIRMSLTVRFTRTLSTLLGNGVGLPETLNLTGSVVGNSRVAAVIADMGTELRKGQDYLAPLRRSELFPPLVVNMLKVGDETGNLGAACGHVAKIYQDKLETTIARLFTILEPIIILLVSALIAGIVISIMGAVFSVNDLALG